MNDHLRKQNFDTRFVTTLVIDEFDKCLEFGFHDEMAEVIGQLPALKKRVLLSATDAEEIPQFTGVGGGIVTAGCQAEFSFGRNRIRTIGLAESNLSRKRQAGDIVPAALYAGRPFYTGIRELSRERGAYGILSEVEKFPCDAFHGGMEQDDRERALYKFRNGSCPVLVSTDLAARGLDIPGIDNVVHYHMPVNEEAFTHRNGRTARWEARGLSFLLLHAEERLPDYLPEELSVFELPEQTPKPAKPRWTTLYIGKGKKDKLNKVDIVGFLYKKGGLVREDVGQVDVKEHYAFVAVRRSKVKQLLTLLRGEKSRG